MSDHETQKIIRDLSSMCVSHPHFGALIEAITEIRRLSALNAELRKLALRMINEMAYSHLAVEHHEIALAALSPNSSP